MGEGVKCSRVNGNLQGPQAIKLIGASSSFQEAKKENFNSECSHDADDKPFTGPALSTHATPTGTVGTKNYNRSRHNNNGDFNILLSSI
jgi:hypothetical protein